MKNSYLIAICSSIIFTGCYDDQALLNDPTINPVENAEDKMPTGYHKRPYRGYHRYYDGYYYYDDYYYYNGYYYRGDRSTAAGRRADDEIVSNGPLSYQHSREGQDARDADEFD